MQKLVFLAQKETEAPEAFPFHADNYGPYSPDLREDLDTFIERGLVDRQRVPNEVGNTRHVYSLTTKGVRFAKEMLSKSGYDILFEAATEVKSSYNDDRLGDLLKYVYQKYPEYTTETDIDLERLFDPEASSQFLESDSQPEFAGDGPEAAVSKMPDADELF